MPARSPRRALWRPLVGLLAALTLATVSLASLFRAEMQRHARPLAAGPEVPEAPEAAVRQLCSACHMYPPPDALPREAWAKEVNLGFRFAYDSGLSRAGLPDPKGVLRYYESHAPEALTLEPPADRAAPPVRLERSAWPPHGDEPRAIVGGVKFVGLTRDAPTELLACDIRTNRVLLADLTDPAPRWKVLAAAQHPARAEVADLDGDGRRDVIVANLGVYWPSDELKGSVVWLRAAADGSFAATTLLDGVGRVADVRAADVTGDGKPDLVVAAFGWRATGELLLLENRTTDPGQPRFEKRVLDARHGAMEVGIADLNRDGHPDIVCVFAQEHEAVTAFLGDGRGGFTTQTVFQGPHPLYGCSGIELADLDGDGDLDVLLANGDVLDQPVLKPYHGVQWLENAGRYPFTHHAIGPLCGASCARAIDFNGDGRLDIAAVSYLPARDFPDRDKRPAVVLYEQTERGRFRPLVLDVGRCDNLCCAVGRLPGDALPSLVVGHGDFVKEDGRLDAVTIWRNRGPR